MASLVHPADQYELINSAMRLVAGYNRRWAGRDPNALKNA